MLPMPKYKNCMQVDQACSRERQYILDRVVEDILN